MHTQTFDIIIIGAGPAGSACALSLADSGLNIAVLDKGKMTQDKVCGDALSLDVIRQLEKLPAVVKQSFDNIAEKIPSYGIRFYSPKHECLEISFEKVGKESISGMVCKRRYFDEILIHGMKQFSNITLIEDCEVTNVIHNKDCVEVITAKGTFNAKMIVGADGTNSVIAKKLAGMERDKSSICLGLRGYFKNVSGFHPDNYIELHFDKEVLPGYIWLFPMANNTANIGIGMLASDVSKKKINLKTVLEKFIHAHPEVALRFKDAEQTGKYEAWSIPLGTKKRNISGDIFLLAGDAASLVDPFTGEGVGNALRSGRVAADHIRQCFGQKHFDADFNLQYDEEIYHRMGKELRMSYNIQKAFRYPCFVNTLFRKASRNVNFKEFIIDAAKNPALLKKLWNPLLLYRIFLSNG